MHGEDDVSYGRNLDLLKAEIVKSKPRGDVLKDLMTRTFPNRWDAFVNKNQPTTLLEYLSLFPLLKKTTYVSPNGVYIYGITWHVIIGKH